MLHDASWCCRLRRAGEQCRAGVARKRCRGRCRRLGQDDLPKLDARTATERILWYLRSVRQAGIDTASAAVHIGSQTSRLLDFVNSAVLHLQPATRPAKERCDATDPSTHPEHGTATRLTTASG